LAAPQRDRRGHRVVAEAGIWACRLRMCVSLERVSRTVSQILEKFRQSYFSHAARHCGLVLGLCLACLAPVFVHTGAIEAGARDFVPFTTDYGTIRVSRHMSEGYKTAIEFIKEKVDLGKTVLSVPEDTSLYFFSGTVCPTRIFLFIPGAVAPGKMTEQTIQQIERKPVDYLLWSNRMFTEYGAKEFGKDFNPELGEYLTSHYRPIYPLVTADRAEQADKDWTAMVWKRKPDVK
jgi:hypothetical protein